MHTLSFIPSPTRSWFNLHAKNRSIHVTGWAFADNVFLHDGLLSQHIENKISSSHFFSEIFHDVNGNFAVVVEDADVIHICVDAVRSIPLFYRQDGSTLFVSDDIKNIKRVNDTIDLDSLIEFATAGYVTGPYTLFSEISGLQSGECVSWSATDESLQVQRYYKYICTYDEDSSVEDLCEMFDGIVIDVFKRIIETLEGRQVVVPLSGGLDSRLIASMLKRLGYDNVVCLSYGIPDNHESIQSQKAAEKLEFRWAQVPYSAKMLKAMINSDEMSDYQAFAANHVSFPHIDDWPAVNMLRKLSEFNDDMVFMPGHTGDFICGSHLKYVFNPATHEDPYDFNEAMIKKHYSLWENLITKDHIRNVVEQRLDEALEKFPRNTHNDLACMYEYWEWQERQAKYIINSIRVYDFFGFSWRIPLWDRGIMDFWKRIPISLKMNSYLYRSYLAYHDPTGVFQEETPKEIWNQEQVRLQQQSISVRLKKIIQSTPVLSQFFNCYRQFSRHYHMYKFHPLGFPHIYSAFRYICLETSKRQAMSLLLRNFLRDEYGVKFSDLYRSEKNQKYVY